LDDIGLISFQPAGEFTRRGLSQKITPRYYGKPLTIEFQARENNQLQIGEVILTKIGAQLAPICGSKTVDGCEDYVVQRWAEKGLTLSCPYPKET
jgi:hypothetical protein